jgi:uncharacterized membrane protein
LSTRKASIGSRKRALTVALLLAITLVGGSLRAWNIDAKSLWIDEAFSAWVARQPVSTIPSWLVQIDQHPPLYYLVLGLWMQIGGRFGWSATPEGTAAWMRALSALVSTLNIPALYALGRRLAGRRVGLLAASVLALAPFHVYLGQEARMYSLLCLYVSLAMLALAYITTPPPPKPSRGFAGKVARPPPRNLSARWTISGEIEGRLAWATYILSTAAALWTHNTALLFFAAANLYVLGLIVAHHRGRGLPPPAVTRYDLGQRRPNRARVRLTPPPLWTWMLAQAGVVVLWSPWIVPFIRQARGVYEEFWLPAPTWSTVAGAIQNMMSAFMPSMIVGIALLWALYVTMVLLGVYCLRRRPAVLALLAVTFITPIAGELLVSLRQPIFYDRTLIWASISLYLLFAVGLDSSLVRNAPSPRLGGGMDIAFSHRLASRTRAWSNERVWYQKLDLRRAIRFPWQLQGTRNWALLPRHILSALGLLLLVLLNILSLRNYISSYRKEQWDDAAAYVARHIQDGDLILYHASWTQLPFDFYFDTDRTVTQHGLPVDLFDRDLLEPKMTEADLARLYELISDHDRVWLVYSHNWYTDPHDLIPAALVSKARLLNREQFYGLEIYLFAPHTRI